MSAASGIVQSTGTGVPGHLAVGTRVVGMVFGGAWAEYVCADARLVSPVSAGTSPEHAAALAAPYGTAHYALAVRAAMQAGESVFVMGSAGSVGMAAIQVAKALGGRVIAGAQGAAKLQAAAVAGADATVDLAQPDWKDQVRAWARSYGQAEGVDIVLDPLGAGFTDPAFRCLQWGGRHLVIGFAGGEIPALRTNLALLKGSLVGVDVRQFMERQPAAYQRNLAAVCEMFGRGELRPLLHSIHAISDSQQALTATESRQTIGRVVMRLG